MKRDADALAPSLSDAVSMNSRLCFSAEKYEKKILDLSRHKLELEKELSNVKGAIDTATRLGEDNQKVNQENQQLQKDILVRLISSSPW